MKKIVFILTAALMIAGSSCAEKASNGSQPKVDTTEMTETEVASENTPAPIPTDSMQSGSCIKTIDSGLRGANILPAITKHYEGRVVLIDFWATWCPPCRKAMKDIDQIKSDLLAKGACFAYITGETSPEKDWNNMITTIEGDHCRLTDVQWSELCSQLAIPGIPAYLLLNKDGSVAFSNLTVGGYPGNEVIQNQIEIALTK
jgi:thiol-disulfide isomerase/thioredoxin